MMNLKTVLLLFSLLPLFAQASDLAKEQRWKEQVVADLFDGEAIDLNDGSHDFLALSTAAETPKANAIIVMHGIGIHPDWPQVVNPLRVQLAEQGWSTLSIQLPILDNSAAPEEYNEEINLEAVGRIEAAVAYLKSEGAQGIYLVAHSMGARMASYFLANSEDSFKGFVGIGMNVDTPKYLGEIKIPVLDLYGSDDLEGVLGAASSRAEVSTNNPAYRQQIVDGADHFFNGMEEELLTAVSAWLAEND